MAIAVKGRSRDGRRWSKLGDWLQAPAENSVPLGSTKNMNSDVAHAATHPKRAQPACDKVTPLRANPPAAVPRTTHGILTSGLVNVAEKVELDTFSGVTRVAFHEVVKWTPILGPGA